MAEITRVDNINAFSAAILLISNGIAPSIPVEPVTKWHQDMHLGHVEDEATTTVSVDITTLMATKMEILPENVDLRQLFALIYFPDCSKGRTILYDFFPLFFHFYNNQTNYSLCFSLPLLVLTL
jgi:hypothetical protein